MQRIAVWDEDREYAARLTDYLNRHGMGRWTVVMVNSVKEWQELQQQQDLNGVILGNGFSGQLELATISESICCFYLSEEPVSQEKRLYRYAGAGNIQKCLEQYLGIGGMQGITDGIETTAVLSVLDRAENRRRIQHRAAIRNAFYWEMTAYSDYEDAEQGAARILFGIKGRDASLVYKMQEYLMDNTRGSVMAALDFVWDYRELDCEDLEWFFEQLRQMNYQEIYVYMDMAAVKDSSICSCFSRFVILSEGIEEYCHREQAVCRLLELMGVSRNGIEIQSVMEWEKGEE